MLIEILIKKQFKGLMMSSDEPIIVETKGEALVKHCPLCGAELIKPALTNHWLEDQNCQKIFQVRVPPTVLKTGE